MGFANKVPYNYSGCDAFAVRWGVLVLGLTASPSHRIVLATLSACLIVPQLAVRQVVSVGTWLALYVPPRVMIAQMMRAVLLASAMAASRTGFRARRSIKRGSTLSGVQGGDKPGQCSAGILLSAAE